MGGGGPLNLEILRGGGARAVSEIQVEGGGVKTPSGPSVIGVWIFSGMTRCQWGNVKQGRWMVPIDSIPLCLQSVVEQNNDFLFTKTGIVWLAVNLCKLLLTI